MAFRIGAASKFTKTLTVDFAGQILTFDYLPYENSIDKRLALEPQRRQVGYDYADALRWQSHFEVRRDNELARLETGDITDPGQIATIMQSAKELRELAESWRKRSEELNRAIELIDVEEVCRLVERWDAVDDNEQAIPTDNPERIAKLLPQKLLEAILKAIDQDIKVDPQNAPLSSSTSSAEASAATVQSGISTTS
jgi:hypothetical protein